MRGMSTLLQAEKKMHLPSDRLDKQFFARSQTAFSNW
jgi:hypothetical protein